MPARRPVEIGEVFGKMTVLASVEPKITRRGIRRASALVRCECGTEWIVAETNLRSGNTKACAQCRRYARGAALPHTTHGMTKTPIYRAWSRMKERCYQTRGDHFAHYGARGITVCERWLTSFENFFADMAADYRPGLTLDRIDVNGNYEPSNCRWATTAEQNRNRRDTVWLVLNGDRICLSEASRRLGISPSTIPNMARQHGVSLQEMTDLYAENRIRRRGRSR